MVFSVFPAFLTAVLNAGAASLGLVDGFAEALSNLFKLFAGNLSDKVQSRKPLVVAGYVLSVLTRPFYMLVSTVGGAFGLRALDRVGKDSGMRRETPLFPFQRQKKNLGNRSATTGRWIHWVPSSVRLSPS
jgi:MFS-type transporter involved in bile tolerance (Atg22 family)